jgi:hypothetical protein
MRLQPWVSGIEVIVVAGTELNFAAALDGQSTVPIEFDFVAPLVVGGQSIRAQEQHRIDELRLRPDHASMYKVNSENIDSPDLARGSKSNRRKFQTLWIS